MLARHEERGPHGEITHRDEKELPSVAIGSSQPTIRMKTRVRPKAVMHATWTAARKFVPVFS
jgi:hypothetical protein